MPFKMVNKGAKEADINIYGMIGNFKMFSEDVSPTSFKNELEELGDIELINVYLNTPGGGVYAGITIGDILKNHPAAVKTIVQGMCASIGVTILQAGDERSIAKNGSIYVHNPMGCACGYETDMMKMAKALKQVKEPIMESFDRVSISKKKLSQLMDEETTLTAREALNYGFVDSINDTKVKANVKNNIVTFDNYSFDSFILKNFDTAKIEQFDGVDNDTNNEPDVKAELLEMENRYHTMVEMDNEIMDREINNLSGKGTV